MESHMKVEEHNHLQNLLKIPFQKALLGKVINTIKKNDIWTEVNIFFKILGSDLESIILIIKNKLN
jgi:hypothetical protein